MSDNNHMWTAIAILGGIYAYSMLKADAGKLKDGVVDLAKEAVKEVKIAVDPTDAENLASRLARGIFGEDNIINGVGGTIARITGTDPMQPKKTANTKPTDKPKPTPSAPKEYQSYNPRAANYRANSTKPTAPKKTEAGLPARQSQGTWLKLQGGKWIPLTKNDKVFTVRGANVVHHHTWKPS